MSAWRRSKEYRHWRIAVIRRDGVCQICGSLENRHAHHLEDASNHKELRFDVDNGVTLCRRHHTMFHTSFKNSYRAVCHRKDFLNFKELYEKLKEEFLGETDEKLL